MDLHDDTRYTFKNVFNETGTYSTHLYTSKAVDMIRTHNPRRPFFLYLAYQAVHGPLQVTYAFSIFRTSADEFLGLRWILTPNACLIYKRVHEFGRKKTVLKIKHSDLVQPIIVRQYLILSPSCFFFNAVEKQLGHKSKGSIYGGTC